MDDRQISVPRAEPGTPQALSKCCVNKWVVPSEQEAGSVRGVTCPGDHSRDVAQPRST